MTPREPIPCAVCGQPVYRLGAVQWRGSSGSPDGYLTGLYPVCTECVADQDMRFKAVALMPEVVN